MPITRATRLRSASQLRERRLVAPGDGGDHAVDQSAGLDASLAAAAVDSCGTLEVGGGVETVQMESQQKAAQVRLPGIAARRPGLP